jgi:uncharacterized RDD family membrane protein YckC
MTMDSNTETGVYYNIQDYGSLLRRFIAVAVDLAVLILLSLVIAWLWAFFADFPDLEPAYEYGWESMALTNPVHLWCCLFICYLYMAVVKPTKLRTIGYRIADLRVVDLQGVPPSFLQMSWRLLLLVFGPFSLVVDLIWLGGNPNRQTLRDKLAGTYVIRLNEAPMGTGTIVHRRYFFLGWSFLFREVKRNRKEDNTQQAA